MRDRKVAEGWIQRVLRRGGISPEHHLQEIPRIDQLDARTENDITAQ